MRASHSGRGLHNVPAELTSFVGRRRERAEIRRLLSSSHLVTLTGSGGVGKTRLALRAASDVQRAFPDGVWLVELAALEDPVSLGQAVFTALGLRDQSARWLIATLSDYLAGKRLLLVIDNCEHVLEGSAVLAGTLLRTCDGLRILATSRQALGIAGESILTIDSLDSPEAVALFADRAAAVRPGLIADGPNRSVVVNICLRLDGIPLAIELAAVRTKSLSVEQVLERLDNRFTLLRAGSRTAMPHHQTLQATIDWSYDLLPEAERVLWRRSAVFADGFELEAAERVCAGDCLPVEAIVDLVGSLVDKSILVRDQRGSLARYRLLETIRQYGQVKLQEAGEETPIRRRHRNWVATVAGEFEADWWGPHQLDWLARIEAERGNIRSALEFCLTEPGEAAIGLDIWSSLWLFWYARGPLTDARRIIEALLQLEVGEHGSRAKALCFAGYLAVVQGEMPSGVDLLHNSLPMASELSDGRTAAYATQFLGLAALFTGDLPEAARLLEEAVRHHLRNGDPEGEAHALLQLAVATSFLGDKRRSIAQWEQSRDLSTRDGDQWTRSYALWGLGLDLWLEGDYERAARMQRDALVLKRAFDERIGIALCIEALAWIAASETRFDRAARLMGAARAVWNAVPAAPYEPFRAFREASENNTRAALAAGPFDAAFRLGLALDTEGAIRLGLEERSSAVPATRPSFTPGTTLTPREQEIAALVADGLSNKQIAAKLVISERTAENHILNILNKLGFNARTQIASWATAHQPGERESSRPSRLVPR